MITGISYFWRGVVMVVATRVAVILRHILKTFLRLLGLFNDLFMSSIPSIASFLFYLQFLFKIRLLRGENHFYMDKS